MDLLGLQIATLSVWGLILLLTESKIIFTLGVFFMVTCDGWEGSKVFTHSYTKEKVLVSTAPSHTQIEGKISGNFLMFSGVLDEKRVYLLREEISKGLYKDFEVKKEVYIREDNRLTNKGKFVQHFSCHDISTYYDLYGYELLHTTKNKCSYQKQEIVVPVGSVIK